MSRVSYVMMNPGGEVEMTRAVRQAIGALIDQVAAAARIDAREILELTFVGNPIMHHLLLGIDPTELGGAPFALATDRGDDAVGERARPHLGAPQRARLRAAVHRRARRRGHRGRDPVRDPSPRPTRSCWWSTSAPMPRSWSATAQRLLAASSPTGPAFEGAQISCGQRAAPGAIERVRVDPRDPGAALQGDRLRSVVGRARLRRGHHAASASPGSAARASSKRSPRCSWPAF